MRSCMGSRRPRSGEEGAGRAGRTGKAGQARRDVSTLVVMAAGLGSRYGSPKQIDRVGPSHETLVEYAVFDARRAGFTRVVFVIRPDLSDAFKDLAARLPADIAVDCAIQDLSALPPGV